MRISLNYFIKISVLLLFFSCGEIFFENPQPVSAKNLYEFPKEFIGSWYEMIDGEKQIALFINKNNIYWEEESYDVSILKKEVDTSSHYLIKNKKIYVINMKSETYLSQGFPYKMKNDTVYFKYKYFNEIALSKINFIRKIDNYFILNMKNENQWYSLILFYINKNKQLIVRSLSKKDIEKLNQEEIIFQKSKGELFQVFTNQKWTKSTIIKFIDQGGFSDTLMHLPYHEKTISTNLN